MVLKKNVYQIYEGLVDDPEVTIEGRGKHVKH